jgi:ribonuclease D
VRRLRAAGEIALDTEGDSLHHYPERLALVQVAVPTGEAWLVDPLALPDLDTLAPVFADPGRVTVLHAGDNDLAQLKRRHAFRFASVFDTSIAARFLGARALGLDVLLAQHVDVALPPSRQKDDWSARPLSDAQVRYAVADVLHLFGLKQRLVEALRPTGRLPWVEEECAALAAQPPAERAADPEAFTALRGARDLSSRGLAVLRALHAARERLALAADRPPFKVLADDLLVRLAAASPDSSARLGQVRGVTPRLVARWGAAILDAIAAAPAAPDPRAPRAAGRRRPPLSPAVSRRVEALRRWRADAVTRFELEAGVLLPNRLIRAIAEAGPKTREALAQVSGVRRWRVDTFGAELIAATTSA